MGNATDKRRAMNVSNWFRNPQTHPSTSGKSPEEIVQVTQIRGTPQLHCLKSRRRKYQTDASCLSPDSPGKIVTELSCMYFYFWGICLSANGSEIWVSLRRVMNPRTWPIKIMSYSCFCKISGQDTFRTDSQQNLFLKELGTIFLMGRWYSSTF